MSAAPEDALGLDAWYGWDADEGDQGWLLTYVDVLSVILAMLLVLLARLGPFAPTEAEPVAAATSVAEAAIVPEAPRADPDPVNRPVIVARSAIEALPLAPAAVSMQWIAPEAVVPIFPDTTRPVLPAPEPPLKQLAGLASTDTLTVLDQDDRGVTLKIADVVLFDSARAELKASAHPILEKVAAALADLGDVDIAVHGHTDDRPVQGGPYGSNWALAAARANAVTAFLLERGFPADRLRAISFADTRPVADNGSDAGRARNRRVEIRAEFASAAEHRQPG